MLAFAYKLESFCFPSIAFVVDIKKEKPTREQVLTYAKPIVRLFISKFAQDIPWEQKEEIEQTAFLRLLEAYEGIDADAGWKSYTYNHCRGAVLDYLKFGKGFAEEKWSLAKEEEVGARHCGKISQRVFNTSSDEDEIDLDHVLGANGIFSEGGFDTIKIKWDLVARMARRDESIHALAKWIRGFSMDEIGVVLGLSRARAGQLIMECLNKFIVQEEPQGGYVETEITKPARSDPWDRQTAFAFGLCKIIGIQEDDQSNIFRVKIGWDLEPVDLDSEVPYKEVEEIFNQLGLFDA